MNGSDIRLQLSKAKRIVIKVGTNVLLDNLGRTRIENIRGIVREISSLIKEGKEVVLISSGAIGSGIETFNWKKRPEKIHHLQMAAAVGQVKLMTHYSEIFSDYGINIAQILLTHQDLEDRTRHLNARASITNLLQSGILPIINENDVVTVDEIKFFDNDHLASLVTLLIDGDMLIMLSTVDGLLDSSGSRVSFIEGVSENSLSLCFKDNSNKLSLGGMLSKLKSASLVVECGVPVVIAKGLSKEPGKEPGKERAKESAKERAEEFVSTENNIDSFAEKKMNSGIISAILNGEDVGTLIYQPSTSKESIDISMRQKWVKYFHQCSGELVVNKCAAEELIKGNISLLPVGIEEVRGDFEEGSLIKILGESNQEICIGLTAYSSKDLKKIIGKRSDSIVKILGFKHSDEVVHIDNMVYL